MNENEEVQQVPTEPDPTSPISVEEQQSMIDAVAQPTSEPETPAEQPAEGKPELPVQYELKLGDAPLALNEEETKMFHDLGLSQDGAERLVKYLEDSVLPQVMETRVELETERLKNTWQIQDSEALAQRLSGLKEWAHKTLPESVVRDLSTTASGMNAMYHMMKSNASLPLSQSTPAATPAHLQRMMNDQRYWDGSDPAYLQEVEAYARRLAGG